MALKYRPEIDGLRAIAVISVVLYHAKFQFLGAIALSGGFIGVDIFFVISGFLITSIILKELGAENTFSFQGFYERRIRRILPALFTVMLVSIPFAWLTMSPKALVGFAGSVISSLFFSSNFWFWQSNSYTAEPSQLQPFLHTWTLSIEEQFYLIFPVMLLLLWRYVRSFITVALVVLSILSLALAQIGSFQFVDANFYLLPSRGWELLAGAVVAKVKYDDRISDDTSKTYPILNSVLPAVGLVLIFAAIFLFRDTMRHPSLLTAAPIAGTVMIIWFARKDGLVTRLLSTSPFVIVGLISYSFYLWHFPVFAFARVWIGELSVSDKIILIVISFALATATYTMVERPFRRREMVNRKSLYLSCAGVFLALVACMGLIYSGQVVPRRFSSLQSVIDFKYDYRADWRAGSCFIEPKDMQRSNLFSNCEIRNYSASNPTLLLWGDSHAAHLFAGYDEVYDGEYNIVQRTSSLCAPIPGLEVHKRPGCKEINDAVLASIRQAHPDKVVLSAARSPILMGELEDIILTLQGMGIKDVELIGPVPIWNNTLPEQLASYIAEHNFFPEYMEGLQKQPFLADQELRQLAQKLGIKYQSPISILCRNEACLTRVGDTPDSITQFDYGHLTRKGSVYVVSRFSHD